MTGNQDRALVDSVKIIRPVAVSLLAFAVIATAMAIKGWQSASLLLAALILGIGSLLVIQIYNSMQAVRTHTLALCQSASGAEKHYVDVLRRIVGYVESRDKYLQGHSERVGRLAESLARKLGLEDETSRLLNLGGQLHDLGLIAISEKILAERNNMGVDAYRDVQRHARVAYDVLRPLEMLSDILPAILHHHERMNGTGYPEGLRGQEIPIEARILAVADAYDAMTHDRPHRLAMTPANAIKELHRCTPAGYDPECVDALGNVLHLPTPAMADVPVADNVSV